MTAPDLLIKYSDGEHARGYGSQYDLSRFMYSGGARLRSNLAYQKIAKDELGRPKADRMNLVIAIKEELESRLHSGHSIKSLPHYLVTLTEFLRFLESGEYSFALSDIEANYVEYAEYLFVRSTRKGGSISQQSAYIKAATLSSILGSILRIPETLRLVNRTRLRSKKGRVKAVSSRAEKQNLEVTFKQGNFLVDIVEGVSKESVFGPLPLKVKIRAGLIDGSEVLLYAGLTELERKISHNSERTTKGKWLQLEALKRRETVSDIRPRKGGAKRWHLVNLRVQAEFLIFIAQTGMNLSQAKELGRSALKYKPLGDSWQVRCYKNRKGGEICFQIYKSYKPFLERFRAFVNHFFPDSPYFFPQFGDKGKNESHVRSGLNSFLMLKKIFEMHALAWVTPRELRNTRVNWLLRRSGDHDLTAEMAQHTSKVLRESYERPSQQRAMVEVAHFWNKHDPIQKKDLKLSVIASTCSGTPESATSRPEAVVKPNCVNPSGCLWCTHHRDVDSQDYVWSLSSFRHLKTIEAGIAMGHKEVPSDLVVDRLSEKLAWFEGSSSARSSWVVEAQARIEEGYYHPNWAPIIELLEK
ncbi:MAG: hypothetical protein JKY58_01545 [Pseudomonas sp.]|nr:hypothetical protein [Pseudomonas sp.]